MVIINDHISLKTVLWFFIIGVGLTACNGLTDEPVTPSNTVEIETVTITTSEEMNNNWPVAIDMVRSHDERLLERIGQLSAKDWFEQKEDFTRNYPELQVDGWEPVPNQQIGPVDVDPGEDWSGYIFADYRNSRSNRVRLNVEQNVILRLNQNDFTVAGEDADSGWWFW